MINRIWSNDIKEDENFAEIYLNEYIGTSTSELLFKIDNCYQSLERVKSDLEELITIYIDEADMMLVGIDEMLINAVEHGNKEDISKYVSIHAKAEKDSLVISIEDQGEGFNWLNQLSRTYDLEDFSERGRGISITRMCFDQIYYNMKGNKVFLVKNSQSMDFLHGR